MRRMVLAMPIIAALDSDKDGEISSSELEKAVAQLTWEKIVLESSLAEAEALLECAVEKKHERPLSSGATLTS